MKTHKFSPLSGNTGSFRENVRIDSLITNNKSRNENKTRIGKSYCNYELDQKAKTRILGLPACNTPNYSAFGLLLQRINLIIKLIKTMDFEKAVTTAEVEIPFPNSESELYILKNRPSITDIWQTIKKEPDAFTGWGAFRMHFSNAWGKPGITKILFAQWKNRALRLAGYPTPDPDCDYSDNIPERSDVQSVYSCTTPESIYFKSRCACYHHITKHVLDPNEGPAWFSLLAIPELRHSLDDSVDVKKILKLQRHYINYYSSLAGSELLSFYRHVLRWVIRDSECLGWHRLITEDHVIKKIYLSSCGVFVIQNGNTSTPFIESAYFPGLHSQYENSASQSEFFRKHSRRTKPRMNGDDYSGYGDQYEDIYGNFKKVIHCIHRTNGSRYTEKGNFNPLRKAYTYLKPILPKPNMLSYPAWRDIVDITWHKRSNG